MNLETTSANVVTMYESIEASVVTDKQNEEAVEAEVITEWANSSPEYMDVYEIDHPEVTKYQYSESSALLEVT